MSKNIYRQVNIKFWSDVWVVEKLNALDRYLFIYLLTNDKANDSGIYQISKRMISFETGITVDELENMWKRIEEKVIYVNGWVVFKNGISNKNWSYNTFKHISDQLENLDKETYIEVIDFVVIKGSQLEQIQKYPEKLKGFKGAYKGLVHNITKHNKTEQDIKTNEKPKKPIKKEDSITPFDEAVEIYFEEIWNLYNYKKGRKKSLMKFNTIMKNEKEPLSLIEKIKKSIPDYLEHLKQESWKQQKGFEVWLNGECWNDEYEVKKTGKQGNIIHTQSDKYKNLNVIKAEA